MVLSTDFRADSTAQGLVTEHAIPNKPATTPSLHLNELMAISREHPTLSFLLLQMLTKSITNEMTLFSSTMFNLREFTQFGGVQVFLPRFTPSVFGL